jgi:hypothetical protein
MAADANSTIGTHSGPVGTEQLILYRFPPSHVTGLISAINAVHVGT